MPKRRRQNLENALRSLWYLYPCLRSFAVKTLLRVFKPPTRPETRANRISWETQTPQDAERGTPPSRKGKFTTSKSKPPRLSQTPAPTKPSDIDKCKSKNEASVSDTPALFNRSPEGHTRPTMLSKKPLSMFNRSPRHREVELNAPTTPDWSSSERDNTKSFP